MDMDQKTLEFLGKHHAAAMVTLKPDGMPHVARVGVALVDGKLWSSGTRRRVRTGNVRRDPRCTLFVFAPGDRASAWSWLALETNVKVLDGPDAPQMHVRLFEVMQGDRQPPGKVLWNGEEKSQEEFLRIMVEEERLIYEFEITRAYGMY